MDKCRCCGANMGMGQEICAQCGASVDEAAELTYRSTEFQFYLRLFNALYHPSDLWQATTARKNHVDLFGQPIRNGAIHYRKHVGPGWGDVVRLSRPSMDRLLYVLFGANLQGQEIVTQLVKFLEDWRRKDAAQARAQ